VESRDVSRALAQRGGPLRYNQLRQEIMQRTQCSVSFRQGCTVIDQQEVEELLSSARR
jgi:hypothetical protein